LAVSGCVGRYKDKSEKHLNDALVKVTEKLGKFKNVNKKAMDQFNQFTDQVLGCGQSGRPYLHRPDPQRLYPQRAPLLQCPAGGLRCCAHSDGVGRLCPMCAECGISGNAGRWCVRRVVMGLADGGDARERLTAWWGVQKEVFQGRMDELKEGEDSIRKLIKNLDAKKDDALQTTFKMVANHFADVFKTIVPGGEGRLIMKTKDVPVRLSYPHLHLACSWRRLPLVRLSSSCDVTL